VTTARGAVLRVELDPARGSELKKARPCVVVQRDAANATSPTLIVCPFTDARGRPGNLLNVAVERGVGGLTKDSLLRCNQIRAVDKERVLEQLGSLPPHVMEQVDAGLRRILDL
jgi:mRNA interferase MazF